MKNFLIILLAISPLANAEQICPTEFQGHKIQSSNFEKTYSTWILKCVYEGSIKRSECKHEFIEPYETKSVDGYCTKKTKVNKIIDEKFTTEMVQVLPVITHTDKVATCPELFLGRKKVSEKYLNFTLICEYEGPITWKQCEDNNLFDATSTVPGTDFWCIKQTEFEDSRKYKDQIVRFRRQSICGTYN